MNEFAEKYKALSKENEAIKADLEMAIVERNTARADLQVLTERLNHLLKSNFISRFDELDPKTHTYALDIRDADILVKAHDELSLLAHRQQHELEMLKECIARMTMERLRVS